MTDNDEHDKLKKARIDKLLLELSSASNLADIMRIVAELGGDAPPVAMEEAVRNAPVTTALKVIPHEIEEIVVKVVGAALSNKAAIKFFEQLISGSHELLSVNADGSFNPHHIKTANAKKLQEAFANIELAADAKVQQNIAQHHPDMDIEGLQRDNLSQLKQSLETMEQYKAAEIFASIDSLEEKTAKIKGNHETFVTAQHRIDQVLSVQEIMEKQTHVPEATRASGEKALRREIASVLIPVHNILVEKSGNPLAVDGEKGLDLADVAPGNIPLKHDSKAPSNPLAKLSSLFVG